MSTASISPDSMPANNSMDLAGSFFGVLVGVAARAITGMATASTMHDQFIDSLRFIRSISNWILYPGVCPASPKCDVDSACRPVAPRCCLCREPMKARHNGCPISIIASGGDSKQEIVGIKLTDRAVCAKTEVAGGRRRLLTRGACDIHLRLR